ncbi:MAG: acyltransferase family protein [Eubacteriales bacterium]|nr:acyltransferase family protein [Eubacteriales bacterium]
MKRRMVYPDVLRALSCVAVVFLSTSMASGSIGVSGLLTWAAPMFVMLSGMFFLDSGWYISSRDMAQKYGLRVLISYIVWGVIAMVVNELTGGVLSGILSGSTFYLNFLFVMIILYAFSPMMRIFTRSAQPRELWYFVLLGFVIGCVYPFFQIQLGTTRMVDYALMGVGYLAVFVAGWYLRTAFLTRKQVRIFYLLGGACLILTLRGIWLGASAFSSDPALMIISPDAVLIAIALFLVVKNTLAGTRLPVKVLRPISRLAQLSFGIYLIHPILLAVICFVLNLYGIVLPKAVFVILVSIVLLVVSGLLTFLLRKIPKVGRYIA